MTTNARSSQIVTETLGTGSPNVRTSQSVIENLGIGSPDVRASQVVLETLDRGHAHLRASQIVTETLDRGRAKVRASQVIVEVLLRSISQVPLIYPSMPGLGYSTFWTPNFYNQSEATVDGVNVDGALSAYPTHEFELTYDFLRGQFQYGSQEFTLFMGWFLKQGGQAGRFLFPNPDDHFVQNQPVGTTDGATNTFGPLKRTFGVGEISGTEPVGYVDLSQPVHVYFDGVEQDPTGYSFDQTIPMKQYLKFSTTPSAGKAVTIDYGYFYYCKFTADNMTFETFMKGLTLIKKVTLRSCKAGT